MPERVIEFTISFNHIHKNENFEGDLICSRN